MANSSVTSAKLLALVLLLLQGCSADPAKKTDADGGDTGPVEDVGGARDASQTDVTEVPTSCQELGFLAAGGECDSCQLSCDCPDGFPISIAHCTDDGCLQGADCAAVCLAGLEFAFDCTDVYTAPRADGEPCTRRAECASANCVLGQCASWKAQWNRAFHTSAIAGELQNEVAVEGLVADDFGVRAAIYSKYGSSLDGSVLTVGRVIGLDRDGEVRFSAGLPGDRVGALHVVDDDSLVTMRFSRPVTVGGEMLTPDDDDDWYVARLTIDSDIVWSQHLLSRPNGSATAVVGEVYVVAYQRTPDELAIAGFSVTNGDTRWETVLQATGNYSLAASTPDSQTALVVVTTSNPATIGTSTLAAPGAVALRVDPSDGSVQSTILDGQLRLIGADADASQYFFTPTGMVRAAWVGGALDALEPLAYSASIVVPGGDYTAAIVSDGWDQEELDPGVVLSDPSGQLRWIDAALPLGSKVAVAADGTVYVGAAGAGVRIGGETFDAPGPRELRASLFFFEIGP